jgi:hypothetical protein
MIVSNGKGKKTVVISGIRIAEEAAQEYRKALKHYDIKRPDFARMCINRLIQHYQAGDALELPISFKRRRC